jgi:hypothetical protein
MKSSFLCLLAVVALFSIKAFSQQPQSPHTWTYTYIKAKEGQRENLIKYLERNWFSMDSVALQQGLFNDYRLIHNNDTSADAKWDYIVAVEYFTRGTYSDIEDGWLKIKQNHKTALVSGKTFPDLGTIVDSQELIFERKETTQCRGPQYDDLKPYLGSWDEYSVTDEGENLFGRLKIFVDPNGCSLRKEFQLLARPFSYSTLGYFDKEQKAWIETFSGGIVFKWVNNGDDILMVNLETRGKSRHRNRWTKPENGVFQIFEERSADEGKTWNTKSVTKVKKRP